MENVLESSPAQIQPSKFESITDVLSRRAREQPDRLVFGWIREGLDLDSTQTFLDLETRARSAAGSLLSAGCQPGDRILLMFGTGPEFITSFFACLYAGALAVPICPPRPNQKLDYCEHIASDARPKFVLTRFSQFSNIRESFPSQGARCIDFDEACQTNEPAPLPAASHELAFLQYTSGSISRPKGVMVSQKNLMANFQMIAENFELDEQTVTFDWLPHYHDMGLIASLLLYVFLGARSYHIAPASFLQRPHRWLAGATRYRATMIGSPNFGYEHCVKYVRQEHMDELDLTHLRTAYCGAEPIRQDTLRRFADKFAGVGFRFDAFHPCYGMAESTLFTAGSGVGSPIIRTFSAVALDRRRAVAVEPDAADSRALVSSGHAQTPAEVIIVDPVSSQSLKPGEIGEIWIRGPHVAHGYFQQPSASEETFNARLEDGRRGYLRTGDLGFIEELELFVTGRHKDLIIIDGRNLYPHDIERSVESAHPAIRTGRIVAFSIDSDRGERLVVVSEVHRMWLGKLGFEGSDANQADTEIDSERRRLVEAIRTAIANDHAVALFKLVVTPVGGIPVTTSGKLRRRQCRLQYLENQLAGLSLG